jgi:hypothetical protein
LTSTTIRYVSDELAMSTEGLFTTDCAFAPALSLPAASRRPSELLLNDEEGREGNHRSEAAQQDP